MILLDGKAVSQKIIADLRQKISKLASPPRLDLIIVGHDPASQKYVEMKQKMAESIGINGQQIRLPATTSTVELLHQVDTLNQDPLVPAFMIQLPLPSSIDTQKILYAINPAKDADGLNPINLGKLFVNDLSAIASATPLGIMKLFEYYKIDLIGKNAVIIGRSPVVGLPLFAMLNNANASVTLCHSHTTNLTEICQKADILISAIGKPKFVNDDMVKDGAVVIDVGTNYDSDGHLCGDVDFNSVAPKCSHITPVPGGIGPMTIASLLSNAYKIFINNYKKR